MQPGLQRLQPGDAVLHPLPAGSALWNEKQAVVQAGQDLHCLSGFDAADAINTIAAYAQSAGLAADFPSQNPLALQWQEDFAVLQADGTVPWLCVCLPSHWAPEDKLGQSLAQIHAPVADADSLRAASGALARLVTGGEAWQRAVWSISPSNRYDQHPRRHPRTPWPSGIGALGETAELGVQGGQNAQAFAQACWLRTERQMFLPVRRADGSLAGQSVFCIHVALQPLTQAVQTPATAQALYESLRSMSDAVLAYKGLGAARAPLLQWLRTQT